MNYVTLLSLCLLVPVFLSAADLPEMENMLTGLQITKKPEGENVHALEKAESQNTYVALMRRQWGKPVPVAMKRSFIHQERQRILKEAHYTEESYVEVGLGADPELMLFFMRARNPNVNNNVNNKNCFAVTVAPYSVALPRRMVEQGYPKRGEMLPYNSIQGIDTPSSFAVIDSRRNTLKYDRNRFSARTQQAWFSVPNIVILEHTGINEVNITELVATFPNMRVLILNPHVPAASRKKNADSIGDTKVDILYGGWKKDPHIENPKSWEYYAALPYQNPTVAQSQDPVLKAKVEDVINKWINK